MRNLKLTLAYDGTTYAGWQVQPGCKTVQGTLEAAIEKIIGQGVRVLASGRTDAGVHALGQVVGLRAETELPVEVLQRALNAELPQDMAVLKVEEAFQEFHPIRDALRKHYRYVICDAPIRDVFRRRYCWHYRGGRLDAEAMSRAARSLLGTHDFRSFESSGAERKGSVRTVFDLRVQRGRGGQGDFDLNVQRGRGGEGDFDLNVQQGRAGEGDSDTGHEPSRAGQGDYITVDVEADGFLYNMVRAIVGTLVEVGRGAQPESWPAEVLRAADRPAAGPTAPPQGLFLARVDYDAGIG